jgi:integrase
MSRERRASWGCNQDAGGGKRRLRYWADLRDGKGYRRVSETVEGSRREADEVLAMRRVEHSRDVPCATVAQAFELWWLPDARDRLASGDISRNTLDNALSRWRAHVGPAFGPSQLRDVKPLDVQAWLRPMTSAVAASSLSLLNQIYRFAVMYGACESNPAALRYRMPKARAAEPDRTVYDSGALWAALRAVEGTCAYLPAVLCGIGSARVGESLGAMVPGDVRRVESHGMECAVVDIRRQVDRSGNVMPSLKTPQSERPIIIPEPWSADVLAAGEGWLCGRGDGRPLSQTTVGRVWRETLKAAGIEPIPFRNLRNTWRTVSRWELGIPEDMCEKMMGHAGKGIGERHYDRPEADVFADVVAEAYQRLRSGA